MIDHKKLAAAVVDVLPPPEKLGKSSSDSGDEGDDGGDMGGVEAVKAFFAAGKSGDYSGAYKALEQAVKMCQDDGGDDSGESN